MVSAQYFRRLPYTSTRGLPKPLQLNTTHLVGFLSVSAFVSKLTPLPQIKNPVTFVTGFVPFAGMSSIEIEAELNKLIYLENN
jgi:hypothetical protein